MVHSSGGSARPVVGFSSCRRGSIERPWQIATLNAPLLRHENALAAPNSMWLAVCVP
jgi:hypothetical protein